MGVRMPIALTAAGLCAECRHVRLVPTDRGEAFLRCALSTGDGTYARYPHLPVTDCSGYDRAQIGETEPDG